MAEVSGHTSEKVYVIKLFHNINSILHTTRPKARILLKVINVSHGENLALFTVNSIRKAQKTKIPK